MPWTAVVCRGAARLRLIRSERPVHDFAVRIAGAKSLPAIAFFDQYDFHWHPPRRVCRALKFGLGVLAVLLGWVIGAA